MLDAAYLEFHATCKRRVWLEVLLDFPSSHVLHKLHLQIYYTSLHTIYIVKLCFGRLVSVSQRLSSLGSLLLLVGLLIFYGGWGLFDAALLALEGGLAAGEVLHFGKTHGVCGK